VAQVADVVDAIAHSVGTVRELFVDGGPTRTDGLMQMQADRLGCTLLRAREPELSAIGAAHLAGFSAGLWSRDALAVLPRPRDRFDGRSSARTIDSGRWRDAVARARSPRIRECTR
jgi:glycerol kinase